MGKNLSVDFHEHKIEQIYPFPSAHLLLSFRFKRNKHFTVKFLEFSEDNLTDN